MDISFIIPVLNGEKYIHQCLESIFSETTSSDEIIVADNGSTDKTVEIVEAFSNIQLLILPKLTVSALRNCGAALSSKPLLALIDWHAAYDVQDRTVRREEVEAITRVRLPGQGGNWNQIQRWS
jgi:glycosyltransferase involved in cell wall biosynthesis